MQGFFDARQSMLPTLLLCFGSLFTYSFSIFHNTNPTISHITKNKIIFVKSPLLIPCANRNTPRKPPTISAITSFTISMILILLIYTNSFPCCSMILSCSYSSKPKIRYTTGSVLSIANFLPEYHKYTKYFYREQSETYLDIPCSGRYNVYITTFVVIQMGKKGV